MFPGGMSTVRLTRELLAEGYSHRELAHQVRAGALLPIRRGAYERMTTPGAPEGDAAHAVAAHLRLVRAAVRVTAPTAVVSHLSAAVLHGLPVLAGSLSRVQLTRADIPGGKCRGGIRLYAAPLHADDLVTVEGIAVTSLARTVLDLGRTVPFRQAVMTGDAALRRGLARADLDSCLLRSTRWPGMPAARRVVAFLDPRSESAGESLSRVALHTAMVPPPQPQFEVRDRRGKLVGRADFGWQAQRTLGEFDGRVKYGRLLKPGESAGDVIYREKLREDALRDLDWQVVRWTSAELMTFGLVTQRLERAFVRGTPQST